MGPRCGRPKPDAARVKALRRDPQSNGDFVPARIAVWLFGWKGIDGTAARNGLDPHQSRTVTAAKRARRRTTTNRQAVTWQTNPLHAARAASRRIATRNFWKTDACC